MTIIVATANIQNDPNLPRNKVVKCGRLIGAKKPDFIGFQELTEQNDHEDILTGLGNAYRLTDHTQNCIGFNNRKWKMLSHGFKLATHGVAGITPNLYIAVATFQRRFRPFDKKITIVNTHMVPLTLHGRRRDNYAERLDMWQSHWDQLHNIVIMQEEVTFVTADFNNILFSFNVGKCLVNTPLDKIFVVNNERTVTLLDRMTVETPSDHHTQMVKVEVK